MNIIKTVFGAVFAYGLMSVLLFGGPFHALGFVFFWNDRLGVAHWPALIPVAMVLAVITTMFAVRSGMPRFLCPTVFISMTMFCSALLVGGYAENQRGRIIKDFEPDVEIRSSIFASFRSAPRDFQFFLHGAALKGCKPYAWSYRIMNFYELHPNAAINVLPPSWRKRCKIQQTR